MTLGTCASDEEAERVHKMVVSLVALTTLTAPTFGVYLGGAVCGGMAQRLAVVIVVMLDISWICCVHCQYIYYIMYAHTHTQCDYLS